MKTATKRIFEIVMVAITIGLMIPVYFYWKKNSITETNQLIRQAKRDYNDGEFVKAYRAYRVLVDTLNFSNENASFNYSNAMLMTSDFLKTGLFGRSNQDFSLPDSLQQEMSLRSFQMFTALTTSQDSKLASLANNQLGYVTIKAGELTGENEIDNKFAESLVYFQEALRKDPGNDEARYNYELIKKLSGFSEMILSQTKAMVAEQRYQEAAELLEKSMQRDVRLRSQKELLTRIKSVIAIDSAFTKRNL